MARFVAAAVVASAGVALAGVASAAPMPGIELLDDNSSCTAGFVTQNDEGDYYLLTSGHCDSHDGSEWTDAFETPLGRITASEDNGQDRDAAIIRLDPAAGRPNPRIAGRYPVANVLTADQIHVGMTICKIGAQTGETCGPVSAIIGNLVETDLYSTIGDSGSPGYVVNPDGTVSAVGLLMGGPVDDDYSTDFVLLDPFLRQWGLHVAR
ncbi:S1 family peptidase [Mycobacterium sp. UM_Kg1]|uniref:S1 family peptidase n=1 Tax=Mycobacterium sp. UM_Kg1 TaxID=1545691 RepID=UPI00061A9EBC|nr:S1 family peptidase [Mycobacterium sp. UM_Kg1]